MGNGRKEEPSNPRATAYYDTDNFDFEIEN